MVTSHQLKSARDLIRFAGIGHVLSDERCKEVGTVLAEVNNPELGGIALSNARDVARALAMRLSPTADKCGRAASELTKALEVLRSVELNSEIQVQADRADVPRMRH